MADLVDVFARNVRVLREAAGLSRGELARRAGFTESYVSRLELGARGALLATVEACAEVLGVDGAYLLQENAVPRHRLRRRWERLARRLRR